MSRKWWVRGLIADLVIVVLVLANLFVAQGIWRTEDVNVDTVLLVIALVLLVLAALGMGVQRVSLGWLGLAFVVLSMLI